VPSCALQVDRSFKDTIETVPPVSERLVATTCPPPASQAVAPTTCPPLKCPALASQAEARKSSLLKAAAAHGNGLAKLYTGQLK
jgi:hypothetical protein